MIEQFNELDRGIRLTIAIAFLFICTFILGWSIAGFVSAFKVIGYLLLCTGIGGAFVYILWQVVD